MQRLHDRAGEITPTLAERRHQTISVIDVEISAILPYPHTVIVVDRHGKHTVGREHFPTRRRMYGMNSKSRAPGTDDVDATSPASRPHVGEIILIEASHRRT